jgi:hypothetical protein
VKLKIRRKTVQDICPLESKEFFKHYYVTVKDRPAFSDFRSKFLSGMISNLTDSNYYIIKSAI